MKYNNYEAKKFQDNPKNSWDNKSDRQKRREKDRYMAMIVRSCTHPLWRHLSGDEQYDIYIAYQNGPNAPKSYKQGGTMWYSNSSLTWTQDVEFEGSLNQFIYSVVEYTEEFQKYKKKLRDLTIDRLLLSDKN